MKIVEQMAVLLGDASIEPEKLITYSGHLCYKKENQSETPEKRAAFITRLINHRHMSVLEHSNYILGLTKPDYERILATNPKYLRCSSGRKFNIVSGNARAWIEYARSCPFACTMIPEFDGHGFAAFSEGRFIDILTPDDLDIDEIKTHVRMSFHITCDRGISHELVRHRVGSYSQESTRWCDYGGTGISVIRPSEIPPTGDLYDEWYDLCCYSESRYGRLRHLGAKPQTARSVLPMCLKTELVMTMNIDDWQDFIAKRFLELTGPVHPDAKIIAESIKIQIDEFLSKLKK